MFLLRGILFSLASSEVAASNNTVELVADIVPGPNSSFPEWLLPTGDGRFFFMADDGVHGQELWIYDDNDHSEEDAGGVVRLVKDINPGPQGSDGFRFVVWNGIYYFRADDGTHGMEMWRSDGTEAGTNMLKDIYEGPVGSTPSRRFYSIFKDQYFIFTATADQTGQELMVSNGTEAGTMPLADLVPGTNSFSSRLMANFDNEAILFVAYTSENRNDNRQIFTTDGTPEGTRLFATLAPDFATPNSTVDIYGFIWNFVEDNDKIMVATTVDNVGHLWKLTRSTATFDIVRNNFTVTAAAREAISPRGEILMFAHNDGGDDDGDTINTQLWASDGTPEGTRLVTNAIESISRSFFGPTFDGKRVVMMINTRDSRPYEYHMYVSDGTADETRMLVNMTQALGGEEGEVISSLFLDDGRFMVGVKGESVSTIWITDGTVEGTQELVQMNLSQDSPGIGGIGGMVDVDGTVYFRGVQNDTGYELYKVDLPPRRVSNDPVDNDPVDNDPGGEKDSSVGTMVDCSSCILIAVMFASMLASSLLL